MNPDLAALCTLDCPELAPVVAGLQSEGRRVAVCRAALGHLADPTMPAVELASDAGATLEDVPAAYGLLRGDRAVAALTASMFYPHRLKHRLAVRTVAEWSAEPARFARLLAGEPVLSQTVEIHPSKGTCNYRCAMCLWSDKTTLTYATRGLKARGLLSTQQWLDTIEDLRAHGVQTLVISGGGEALLNPDLPVILRRARNLGLRTQLYTTGYNLRHAAPDLWEEIARTHRVRLSIHSPLPTTYAQITGLPTELHALRRVSEHAQRLLDLRDRLGSPLRLGIGFVLMAVNHGEILAMADFAAELGADFLDIRKDEVDVTDGLSGDQRAVVRRQLVELRSRARRGDYGGLEVDLSDELVSLANDSPVPRRRTRECLAKYARPTISPFGILAPCDLKAEPRFADSQFNLALMPQPVEDMLDAIGRTFVPDACAQCMPSSRTTNAVYAKLLRDARDGLKLCDQPFHDPPPTANERAPSRL
jgi:MoaA/NifB/PqqE/SkfB family radical SAM enzyme